MGTENDAGALNKISNIIDMRPISINKHQWMFANLNGGSKKISFKLSQGMHDKMKIVDAWKFQKFEN